MLKVCRTSVFGIPLHTLVSQELAPYRKGDGTRVHIEGSEISLEPHTAQTIAMTCHELATNAAKYGALSAVGGKVAVIWTLAEDGRLAQLGLKQADRLSPSRTVKASVRV